jgi:hypothetical protein
VLIARSSSLGTMRRTDEARPYVLIEEVTGLEVRFEVAVGAVIVIEETNPEESVG